MEIHEPIITTIFHQKILLDSYIYKAPGFANFKIDALNWFCKLTERIYIQRLNEHSIKNIITKTHFQMLS